MLANFMRASATAPSRRPPSKTPSFKSRARAQPSTNSSVRSASRFSSQRLNAAAGISLAARTPSSAAFTARWPRRILNVHPALIPSFCGAGCYGLHVHEKALAYGVKVTGATVHFVTEEPDGGPIVLQKAVDIREDDTPETLQRRVMEEAEWQLLPRAVSLFCEDRLSVEGRLVRIRD